MPAVAARPDRFGSLPAHGRGRHIPRYGISLFHSLHSMFRVERRPCARVRSGREHDQPHARGVSHSRMGNLNAESPATHTWENEGEGGREASARPALHRETRPQTKQSAFLEAFRGTGTINGAARKTHIDHGSHYRWLQQDSGICRGIRGGQRRRGRRTGTGSSSARPRRHRRAGLLPRRTCRFHPEILRPLADAALDGEATRTVPGASRCHQHGRSRRRHRPEDLEDPDRCRARNSKSTGP